MFRFCACSKHGFLLSGYNIALASRISLLVIFDSQRQSQNKKDIVFATVFIMKEELQREGWSKGVTGDGVDSVSFSRSVH